MKEKVKRSLPNYKADLLHFWPLVFMLYFFWLVLSGHFQAKYLIIGAIASIACGWICFHLLTVPFASKGEEVQLSDFKIPYFHYALYWVWLLGQVVIANVQVALIIINPRMPIDPYVVNFKCDFKNPLALVTLANSITLTPGTITVDVDSHNIMTVHALTRESAYALYNPETFEYGSMVHRVARLFGEELEDHPNDDSEYQAYLEALKGGSES